MTKGEQMARVIDKAAAIVEGIFHHTVAKVELGGSPISKAAYRSGGTELLKREANQLSSPSGLCNRATGVELLISSFAGGQRGAVARHGEATVPDRLTVSGSRL